MAYTYRDNLNNTLNGMADDDFIYGYGGDDTLYGRTGDDHMSGGTGNDTYFIDSASDVFVESVDAGTDRVNASVNYTLGANIENLYLYDMATKATGNALNNTIYGNSNANILSGLAGRDILYGGVGQDRFVFSESGLDNRDTIVGFSHADDTIVLRDILDGVTDAGLKGLFFTGGVLDTRLYFEGAGYTGNGNQHSGIYNNTTTGMIYRNPTDNIIRDSVQVCTVGVATAASLDNTDFVYSV
jgi:Ca2+-binding RTX toxin-like protein